MAEKIQSFSLRQHMLVKSFEIYRYCDSYIKDVELHHHDFYEVYLFLGGNTDYTIESHNYHLQPGDLLLINPMELHRPRITQEKKPYERIVLWLNKSFIEKFSTGETNIIHCFDNRLATHTNLLRLTPPQYEKIYGLMMNLVQESHGEGYGKELSSFGVLLQLVVEINRIVLRGPQNHELVDKSSGLITQVLNYIKEHYDEDISLDTIADRFYVSKYHLSHEFKRLMGTSLYSYIIKRRLAVAKRFLSDGMSPTQVYQQCGFGDYANFYRAFKAEYSMNPKKYADYAGQVAKN